jgi:glutamine amidotransferase
VIAIVDFDIGNLAAVANMLHRVGVASQITADARCIEQADRIILPGNGAFDACMRNLRASGLVPLLEERVLRRRVPLLGICVGAQMLGHGSEEGSEPGLGWMDLRVRRFPAAPGLRVPHMGWNEVLVADASHPLSRELPHDARFYFVHSYYIEPARAQDVLLRAHYGIEFAAGVVHENIAGVQFHPEKSHRFGKQLLANFARGAV